MVNRSKDKGTAAESAVAEYLRNHGWPWAERRALNGSTDKGDITGTPGIVWEVKAARDIKMAEWMAETVVERVNARAEHGVLVIKPRGYGTTRIGEWLAAMQHSDFTRLQDHSPFLGGQVGELVATYRQATLRSLLAGCRAQYPDRFAVLSLMPPGMSEDSDGWYRVTTLAEMTDMLRIGGWGTPLEPQ
jgi:hypothetical protein